MKISYTSLTDKGITRDHNEDSFLNDEKYGVFVVADGMGGYQGGDVASKIAVAAVIEYLNICTNQSGYFLEKSFDLAIEYANEKVYKYKESHPEISSMGTTFISLVLSRNGARVFNIGDSRVYQFSNKKLVQISIDHSAEKDVLPDFMRDPEGEGKYSSVLSRAMGVNETVESDIFPIAFNYGDVLLLCSDGLYSMVKDNEIAKILSSSNSLDKRCKMLIQKANDNGGEDNITATLVEINDLNQVDNIILQKI